MSEIIADPKPMCGSKTITEASMSVPELNNFIVSLIKPLRNARVRVIRHLSNKLKKIRGSKKDAKEIEKKINNMLMEIAAIKALKLKNDVIKKLLAREYTEKDLSKTTAPGDRALIRLALQKSHFTNAVAEFRRAHKDWKELAEFMLSKNGGRRFKKRNAKISSENLAKKTLNVADKRAQEQFVNHDQKHQHNKRPVSLKADEERKNSCLEASYNLIDVFEKPEEQLQKEISTLSTTDMTKANWLSSIFCISKSLETPNSQTLSQPVELEHQPANADSIPKLTESVVVPFDPSMSSAPDCFFKIGVNEEDTKPIVSTASRKSFSSGFEFTGSSDVSQDFFMPLDEHADEISRAGGSLLVTLEDEDVMPSRINVRGRANYNRNISNRVSRRDNNQRSFQPSNSRPALSSSNTARGRSKEDFTVRHEVSKTEKLHASWEARKQEKAQQKIRIPPTGQTAAKTHIKFDDD